MQVNPEATLPAILESISVENVKEKFEQRAEDLGELRKEVAGIVSDPGVPELAAPVLERAAREISNLADQLAADTESLAVRFGYAAKRLSGHLADTRADIARQTDEVNAQMESLKAEGTALEVKNREISEAIRIQTAELDGLRKSFANEMKIHNARMDELRRSKD